MSEHREWSAEKGMGLFSTEIAEHNATVRAYRDAMAECERLGKANDEACGQIFDLEQGIASANEALKAELTALKVRVTPHDEQRSECWQILNDALLGLCPTMNLAHAVREAIDTLKARVEELESDLNSVTKHQELCAAKNLEYSAELEAVKVENAALRQPVDADAWKTPLRIVSNQIIGSEFWVEIRSDMAFAACMTSPRNGTGFHFHDPADAARASIWLASYAAAHGCSVGLGARSGPTRAEAEARFKQLFHRSGTSYAQDRNDYLDWLLPQLPEGE